MSDIAERAARIVERYKAQIGTWHEGKYAEHQTLTVKLYNGALDDIAREIRALSPVSSTFEHERYSTHSPQDSKLIGAHKK